MKNKIIYALLGLAVVGLSAYALRTGPAEDNGAADGKIKITASFYPLYFFASEIAGNRADVYNVTPAGAEPHDYELTAQDIVRIENSRLLILLGGGLEPWGEAVADSLAGTNTKILSVGEAFMTGVFETAADPHVWLDPLLARSLSSAIAAELADADPAGSAVYAANLAALDAKLESLHRAYSAGLTDCTIRDFVTSHTAFGYLARRYNLNQVAISGLSPDEEPSPRALADFTEFVKSRGIRYIFFETLVSPKLSETVAREAGAATLVLNPLEGLGDREIAAGKNYFTEMEINLANLKVALACR